jgi:hypothetical protein
MTNCKYVRWLNNQQKELIEHIVRYFGFQNFEDYMLALYRTTDRITTQIRPYVDNLNVISVEKFRPLLFDKMHTNTNIVQKELKELVFKFHKTLDPSLSNTIYYMNRWHLAAIVLHADVVTLVDCDNNPVIDKLAILRNLYFMFSAIMFIVQVTKSVVILNKHDLEQARRLLPRSNLLHPSNFSSISGLLESIAERKAQLILVDRESNPKKIHNVWTGYLRARVNNYANRLKNNLIHIAKEKKITKDEIAERDYSRYYHDAIINFKMEPEPIDDLVDTIIEMLGNKISKQTFKQYIQQLQKLSYDELKMIVNKIISVVGFPLDATNMNQINKLYSVTISIPKIREDILSKYSLQTYSNIAKHLVLYLFMYLGRSPVKDTSNEIDWF